MAQADHDAEFTEYIRARSAWLCRIAYLLCGDRHRADDLAQMAAAKLYQNWSRVFGFIATEDAHVCRDSDGLTVCATTSGPQPAWLTAIGGVRGLLNRVTSLGPDPAYWTTQVFH